MACSIPPMVGKTYTKVSKVVDDEDRDTLVFDNAIERVRFFHIKDCCESVYIESIEGELSWLEDSPLIQAEVSGNEGKEGSDAFQWTFYKFATEKGYVTIRWYGESNGYYSMAVDVDVDRW